MIPAAWRTRAFGSLLLAPLTVVLVAGLRLGVFDDSGIGFHRMLGGLALFHAVLAVVAVRPWRKDVPRAAWPVAVAALPLLVGLLVYAGPASMAAALLLVLVALAAGSMATTHAACALLAGLALVAALVGWLLPIPVHRQWLYLLLALTIVLARRQALARMVRGACAGALRNASAFPAACILLSFAATVASLGLWLPSLNYDDNAVHLVLQGQLLADGYYRLDVQTQSWAVAPWANNVLHAVAAVFAGMDVRAAVAGVWLLLGIDGARRLALALHAPPVVALAAAAVFAAQPFSGYFATTMQVDGASAAILLHLAAVAVSPRAERPGPVAIGAICGLLLGLKTVNLLYVLPMLGWLGWSMGPAMRLRWTARMLAALLPLALPSYAYALWVTGNPLFPFFNAVFQSPYYPIENVRDLKWMAGVDWRAPWDLLFHADRFGQYYPGASGIAVLATLPALLVAAWRQPALRWLAVWALAGAIVLFTQMQYLRYLFPALAVLVVLGVVALSRVVGLRAFIAAVVLMVAADAALMPTTSWIARGNPWQELLREGPGARDGIVRAVIPERALLERLMQRTPDACVLMVDPKSPFVGAGRGRAISMHRRYDPMLWREHERADAAGGNGPWRALLARIDASLVVASEARDPAAVGALRASGYQVIDHEGEWAAWASPVGDGCRSRMLRSRDRASKLAEKAHGIIQ